MKKIDILSFVMLLSAVIVSGCKKSAQKPTALADVPMNLTLNGTAMSYNTCTIAAAQPGSVHTIVDGFNVTNNISGDDKVEFDIVHEITTLQAGEVFHPSTIYGQLNSVSLSYFPTLFDIFDTQPANPQGTVTITSVGSDTISGTFSGELFDDQDLSGTTVKYTVTNGTFTAKIK